MSELTGLFDGNAEPLLLSIFTVLPMVGGGILYWAPLTNPQPSDKIIGMCLLAGYPFLYLFITYMLYKSYKMHDILYSILGFFITGCILAPALYGITFFNPIKANKTYGGLLIASSVILFVGFMWKIWGKNKNFTDNENYRQL
jgi:hypothetical protein